MRILCLWQLFIFCIIFAKSLCIIDLQCRKHEITVNLITFLDRKFHDNVSNKRILISHHSVKFVYPCQAYMVYAENLAKFRGYLYALTLSQCWSAVAINQDLSAVASYVSLLIQLYIAWKSLIGAENRIFQRTKSLLISTESALIVWISSDFLWNSADHCWSSLKQFWWTLILSGTALNIPELVKLSRLSLELWIGEKRTHHWRISE